MLVKKIPINCMFNDQFCLDFLLYSSNCPDSFAPLFYDIETTGLSRLNSVLYLIGAVVYEQNEWILYQWFNDTGLDEKELLIAFSDFMGDRFSCSIQFNGDAFDQPFLEEKYHFYELSSPFTDLPSIDLYKRIRPLKSFLKLSSLKQIDLEKFLQLPARCYPDGKENIKLYRNYIKKYDQELEAALLGHNQEDLLCLGKVLSLLSYQKLQEISYSIEQCFVSGDQLIFHLTSNVCFPVPISNSLTDFSIHIDAAAVHCSFTMKDGKLKQYYSNYKDYVYLINEDTAIPKSLGQYIDKSLKKPAKPETCYTWFRCDDDFLSNSKKQLHFIHHAFSFYLDQK